MELGLTDRVAFVSGASAGLGFAVVEELAREGCFVAFCSRSEARIQTAAERLIASGLPGSRILPLVCDVTDEKQIELALQATTERFGHLNILVTNAGGPPSGYIGDFSADQWREAIELNLISTVNLCRHALPLLRECVAMPDGMARILMITSVSAKQPIPNLYLSNASRAGVQGFARSLAEEVGPEGITVNTILPGYTRTDRLTNLKAAAVASGRSGDEMEAAWARDNALKRIGEPREFAAAATFLVSERAGYITGVAFPVDGGRTKGLL